MMLKNIKRFYFSHSTYLEKKYFSSKTSSIHSLFKQNVPFKKSNLFNGKILVNLSVNDLVGDNAFISCMGNIKGVYILYIKISFTNKEFKMAGSQMLIEFNDFKSYSTLRTSIIDRIYTLLERYENSVSNINHVILTFIPVDFTYINKFKVKISHNHELNKFIESDFKTKTMLPVYINTDFIGKELNTVIENDIIVDVILEGIYSVEQYKLSRQFKIDKKLQKFDANFKFHLIKLNNITYLLAIKHITNTCIRKLRMNLSGNIMEDITDFVLENGNVKRVIGNNVIIINNDKIINSYRNINLTPIRLTKTNAISYSSENPNIGVIDFETFNYDASTSKVYAAGFKTNLDDGVTMFYTDNKDSTDSVVLKLVNELLRSKYNQTIFYCHNLAGFDVIFMLKVLVDYNNSNNNEYKFDFKFRDNNILSITITKGLNKVTIRDSFAMFNSSLSNLAKAYECTYQKGYFPYRFATSDTLFYTGPTPSRGY